MKFLPPFHRVRAITAAGALLGCQFAWAQNDADNSRPEHERNHELVRNGDFAEKNEDGTPKDWDHGGPGKGEVVSEEGRNFLRLVSESTEEALFLENVDRPDKGRELHVTARLRCKHVHAKVSYGVIVAQRDAKGDLVARDLPCYLLQASPGWKTLHGVVKIASETKVLVIKCSVFGPADPVDFADVRVEVR